MDIVEVFNCKVTEMVSDISKVAPEFHEYKTYLELGLSMNKNIAIDMFGNCARKYEPYILKKDESYFLNESYEDQAADNQFDIINKIKKIWTTLSKENKEIIWKYLQVLIILQKKYKK